MSDSTLCFSSWLEEEDKYAPFFRRMQEALRCQGADYTLLEGTRDIWCRDYMPVYGTGGKAVQFRYDPSYLKDDRFRSLPEEFLPYLDMQPVHSELNLDGGNLLLHNATAIVSERVYEENPTWNRRKVERELIEKLELERLIVIPAESREMDMTGHADGMCRIIDDRHILLGDFAFNEKLGENIAEIVERYGFEVLHLSVDPRYYENSGTDWLPAINYLMWEDVIYVPHTGSHYEEAVFECMEGCFGKVVEPVLASEIVEDGGALNCVSWTKK
ncbi:agmatine deiminase family protein [Nitratifractor salsuginis]|uniref:Porphyromonas-type peptidyl-arginine deiminase n=1 Tax=Nitratifractor salsuginis (strain DSM 16511 / JCM 12458 / E9I37-1) TaxID=749222 RepID=E6X2N3_NITSE|nr:agmatine deiminase family protein [Nitratifractor salsuginis]ADV46099.1 Porphyromonas-type peptidyl-arginine deiminase [Nitratifractor salsuginis DSM 16511]